MVSGAGGGGTEVARFYAILGADTSGFTSGVGKAQSSWKGLTAAVASGLGVGVGFGAVTMGVRALTGAIGSSMGAVISYETAFTGITKTVDATAEEFAQLDANIRHLATTSLPVGRNELAGIGQIAGQLGVRGVDNLTKFIDTVAKIHTATNLSSQEAALDFARFSGVMGVPIAKVDELASGVVGLGNTMKTSGEQEIMAFSMRIMGAGKVAGLTADQVFALAGATAEVGVEAEAGGTAVSLALTAMSKAVAEGGDELALFAGISGMTSAEFAKQWKEDAFQAFVAFETGLGKAGDQGIIALDNLGLGGVRARQALVGLSQDTGRLTFALDKFKTSAVGANALNTEFGKFAATSASQITIFKNNVVELSDAIGVTLVNALDKVLPRLNALMQGTSKDLRTNDWGALLARAGLPLGGLAVSTLQEQLAKRGIGGGVGFDAPQSVSGGSTWDAVVAANKAALEAVLSGKGPGGADAAGAASAASAKAAADFEAELKRLNALFGDGAKAADKYADALKDAQEHVEDVMTSRLVEAFIKGGDAQVAVVRGKNAELLAEFAGMMPQLKALGLEIPETAIDMLIAIREGALAEAKKALDALDALRFGAMQGSTDPRQILEAINRGDITQAQGETLLRQLENRRVGSQEAGVPSGGSRGGVDLVLYNLVNGLISPATADTALEQIAAAYGGVLPSHAGGLSMVPSDGYATILHKGEGVLTAAANLNRGGGGGLTLNIVVEGSIVSEGDLGRKVLRIVRQGLEGGGFRDLIGA